MTTQAIQRATLWNSPISNSELSIQSGHGILLKSSGCILALLLLLAPLLSSADTVSARAAMENPANPLVQLSTSQGQIFIELFREEAPNNIAHFIDLINGDQPLLNESGDVENRSYYEGVKFHRVIPGFLIQAGSPYHNNLGPSEKSLNDEISATSLGLDNMPVMNSAGEFHPLLGINSRTDFEEELLIPLYKKLGLNSETEIIERQHDITSLLQEMTVRQAYENQGYRYSRALTTRALGIGTVALANSGPDSNGSEFFINLSPDGIGLTGKYTVIGTVVEGMNIVMNISEFAVSPARFSPRSTTIYSASIADE